MARTERRLARIARKHKTLARLKPVMSGKSVAVKAGSFYQPKKRIDAQCKGARK